MRKSVKADINESGDVYNMKLINMMVIKKVDAVRIQLLSVTIDDITHSHSQRFHPACSCAALSKAC